ncbi:Holliday junction resolvase RuvX [Mailhella massiliensis]|uniref:Putative pre-16S rRNA nuclease n=1 Tax=Mailhella massiliensis TaxID=1903261 RepID=A0A921AVN3_9BACT|nr:Holliday junction resolvase RuvX [Mailhella massiliensis]HJD96911.1 Holliday junction resolvase RuvX [Mailhella massiliensis]
MKYLAIDYGLKRVGIAVSDMDGNFAFPRCTLKRETKATFFAALLALLDEEKAEAVVVGLPLHTDGTECLTTVQVRHFVESLKRRTALPVYWMNEVLSSAAAEHELYDFGMGYRDVKKVVDQQAAVLILESFLNQPEERRLRA